MDDPDLILIDLTGRGDREAFESLVKKYQGPLLNFVTRYVGGDRLMAEDITQEVLLRVFGAARRFEAKTKVSTWIFKIAYNRAMTEMKRRKHHRKLLGAMERSEAGGGEGLAEPSRRLELQEDIGAALERLPESQRAALLLRVREELSYREIADVLGVSVQSVESLLFRARTNLKRDLRKE